MTKGWIELFCVGTHRDSNKKLRSWSLSDLKKIAASYNPTKHEAPIVLGHPEDNSPAYGWVKGLKVQNGKLLGQFSQVNQAFAKWVNEGKFKKRSISLYPDLSLRHVGYLGAMPPAIKGLKDHKFSEKLSKMDQAQEGQNSFWEFTSNEVSSTSKAEELALEEPTTNNFYLLADGRVLDQDGTFYHLESPEVTAYLKEGGDLIGASAGEIEEGLEDEAEIVEEKQTKTEEGDVAENQKSGLAKETIKKSTHPESADEKLAEGYKKRLLQLEKTHNLEEAASFTEGLISKGIITPAQSKGLPEFVAGLAPEPLEFGEQQNPPMDKGLENPRQWLQNFLEQLPTQGHMATLGAGKMQQVDFTEQDQLINAVVSGAGYGPK